MELKRFDLLFVKGTSPVSRIIQDVTGSPYSHVAIVLDKWRVAETNWRRPLKPYPLQYPASMYDIGRYKGEITEAQAERMRRYLYERIGSKYDFWQTITNGLFILSGGRIPIVDAADRLNCSEFADEMYAAGGIDLLPKKVNGRVTPGGLALSKEIRLCFSSTGAK